jgi:hypothetical protein
MKRTRIFLTAVLIISMAFMPITAMADAPPANNPTEPIPAFAFNLRAEEGGTVVFGSSGNFMEGAALFIAVQPSIGYSFSHWSTSGGGSFSDANHPQATFTMPANAVTVTAHFFFAGIFDARIEPDYITYNRSSGGEVTMRLNPGSFTFGRIRESNYTLTRNRDYRVHNHDYTFTEEYLSGLRTGENTVTFEMLGGPGPRLTIMVSDPGLTPGSMSIPAPSTPPAIIPSIPGIPSIPADAAPMPEEETQTAPPVFSNSYTAMDADGLPVLRLRVNDRPINLAQPPVMINGVCYIPLREIFEMFGYQVESEEETGLIRLTRGKSVVEIIPDSLYFFAGGFAVYMHGAAYLVNGHVMAPFAAIMERIGGRAYRDDDMTLHISYSW